MIERTLAVSTHGRYLLAGSSTRGAPLLVGFHGYAESAEVQLERLGAIPGAERWTVVSVQALHRFYRGRTHDVVASWMTVQDRELAIADNVAYVNAVVDAVLAETRAVRVAFAGFSQGVPMAFRAAASSPCEVSGAIVIGGDIPPELDAAALARVKTALIGRGAQDDWYTAEKLANDLARLRSANVPVTSLETPGGHAWSPEFSRAAGSCLDNWR